MAHLGDDVAAFVDGQLSPVATGAAESHLRTCESCRQAVRQQRMLKSRMQGVGSPEPPAELLESLSGLPGAPVSRRPWWSRLLRSTAVAGGVVTLGASMAVVAVAYLAGAADDVADEIVPPFDRYAAEYAGADVRPAGSFTSDAMAELDRYGWSCHARLGAVLTRVAGHWQDHDSTVALVYAGAGSTLNLFEQVGVLDTDALTGFERRDLADRPVWVRDGRPRIVTWDADGVVYTIVTEVGDEPLADAVADLPRPGRERDVVERVGDGLNRMTTWLSAA